MAQERPSDRSQAAFRRCLACGRRKLLVRNYRPKGGGRGAVCADCESSRRDMSDSRNYSYDWSRDVLRQIDLFVRAGKKIDIGVIAAGLHVSRHVVPELIRKLYADNLIVRHKRIQLTARGEQLISASCRRIHN